MDEIVFNNAFLTFSLNFSPKYVVDQKPIAK